MEIKSFDDIIGNTLTVSLIKKGLSSGSLPNLLFLGGVHGIGKSSIAKLIAKALTCLSPRFGLACDICSNCIKNDEALRTSGISTNLHKVNMSLVAKENTIMDQITDIFKLVKPEGNYVKILEEFHSLDSKDQKIFLEETERLSPNITLIITSTSERYILKELVSRCLSFTFNRLSLGESNLLVNKVNKTLKLTPTDYQLIYRKCHGIPRDTVLLLEFLSKNSPTREEIDNYLGVISHDTFLGILSLTNNFRDYHLAFQDLLRTQDLSNILQHFREFLNQLTFAIEGGLRDLFPQASLSLLPELDISTLYKMQKIIGEATPSQAEMEYMFLRIRRLFSPSQTVSQQQQIVKQTETYSAPIAMEQAVNSFSKFKA